MIMGGDPAEVAAPSEMRKLEARRALSLAPLAARARARARAPRVTRRRRGKQVRRSGGAHSSAVACGAEYVPGETLSVSLDAPRGGAEDREAAPRRRARARFRGPFSPLSRLSARDARALLARRRTTCSSSRARSRAREEAEAARGSDTAKAGFGGAHAVCGGARVMGRYIPEWLRLGGPAAEEEFEPELNARASLTMPAAGGGGGEVALVAAWGNRLASALLTRPCVLHARAAPDADAAPEAPSAGTARSSSGPLSTRGPPPPPSPPATAISSAASAEKRAFAFEHNTNTRTDCFGEGKRAPWGEVGHPRLRTDARDRGRVALGLGGT